MTDMTRDELRVYAALLAFCILAMFALLAWAAGSVRRADERFFNERNVVSHIVTACKQADDGSAECPPRTFTPKVSHPTSTTAP